MAHPNHYTTRLGGPSEHESLMITSQGVAENHSRCACQRQCRGCLGRFSSQILIGGTCERHLDENIFENPKK